MSEIGLEDKVTSIRGIGPKYAKALEKLKIHTLEDFLYYYPRTYQDRGNLKKISQLIDGETALIAGEISHMTKSGYGYGRKKTLKVLAADESGAIEIVFFNSVYLEKSLNKEKTYEFFGKVEARGNRLQMIHPEFNMWLGDKETGILPVYPLTQGISQNYMRKWQREALACTDQLIDYLPGDIISRNRLCSLKYAIENIHFPKDTRKIKEAAFRLVFDELFILQLGLLSIKSRGATGNTGIAFSQKYKMTEFTAHLPYELTNAQKRVINQIELDMEKGKIMSRLVQGDVGSGKTVIAAAAAYKAVKSGYQAIMMAPTEILAVQHLNSLNALFQKHDIRVGLLTGSMPRQEKELVQDKIKKGEIDFIIGTHALIQPELSFKNPGLVITDEQHRFGVKQRNLLSEKGNNPDILVMTATPIPRTLAVILYGDLDHSAIDEMPLGRKPILTKVISDKNRSKAYKFLEEQIHEGRQAYIVTPLIEDSEHIDARSSTAVYEEVIKKFKDFNVKLLHGNLKQSEKDHIMDRFNKGEIDVLVSTVVIEVGINVPNAAIMLIENAERFGLATLHQLRGRVGRGQDQSFCILITDSKNEIAQKRAKVMEETNDGFIIAEKDLELRGPGEFFGVKQHGLPQLKIADLSKHIKVAETVKEEACKLLEKDPSLSRKENEMIKNKVDNLFNNSNRLNI